MRILLLCAVMLWTAVASAGPTVIVLTDAGFQTMTTDADGKAVLSPVTPVNQVVDLRTGKTPVPPTPPPVASDPIATQVREWASALNDPTSQQALREVYSRVGAAAKGQSRQNVMLALSTGSDSVLNATGGAEKWKVWRQKVSKLIDEEEAKGPVDWPKFCASVAAGLESGTALDPALLQLIISLILQIIQLFFGGGV